MTVERKGKGRRRSVFAKPNLDRGPPKATTVNTLSMLVDDWVADEGGLADGETITLKIRKHRDTSRITATVTRTGNVLDCKLGVGQRHAKFKIRVFRTGGGATSRRVFVCPNCGSLTERLYLNDLHLVCRGCAKLLYPSQLETDTQRVKKRREKILALLGPPEEQPGLPTRPKGMHQATYERLLDELADLDIRVQAMLEEDPTALVMLGLGDYLISDEEPDGEYRYPAFKRSRGRDGEAPVPAGNLASARKAAPVDKPGTPRIRAVEDSNDFLENSLALVKAIIAEMESGEG